MEYILHRLRMVHGLHKQETERKALAAYENDQRDPQKIILDIEHASIPKLDPQKAHTPHVQEYRVRRPRNPAGIG